MDVLWDITCILWLPGDVVHSLHNGCVVGLCVHPVVTGRCGI